MYTSTNLIENNKIFDEIIDKIIDEIINEIIDEIICVFQVSCRIILNK